MRDLDKPRLPMIVKLDETANWSFVPDWMKQYIKRIFGVYVFDGSVAVHCCELTPSAELHFVQSDYEVTEQYIDANDDECEQIHDFFSDGDAELGDSDVRYLHLSNIDAMPRIKKGEYPPEGKSGIIELDPVTVSEDELSSEDMLEEQIEYIQGNSI